MCRIAKSSSHTVCAVLGIYGLHPHMNLTVVDDVPLVVGRALLTQLSDNLAQLPLDSQISIATLYAFARHCTSHTQPPPQRLEQGTAPLGEL